MRIYIENQTNHQKRVLRRIFTTVIKSRGELKDDLNLVIMVKPFVKRKDGKYWGHGICWKAIFVRDYPTSRCKKIEMKIFDKLSFQEFPDHALEQIIRIFAHEYDHALGLSHDHMADWWKMPLKNLEKIMEMIKVE